MQEQPRSSSERMIRCRPLRRNGREVHGPHGVLFRRGAQGELILLRVCANGFLYNMVRAMTGTVVYAAEGKIRPQDIGRILDSGNRTAAGPTVPPRRPVHDAPLV